MWCIGRWVIRDSPLQGGTGIPFRLQSTNLFVLCSDSTRGTREYGGHESYATLHYTTPRDQVFLFFSPDGLGVKEELTQRTDPRTLKNRPRRNHEGKKPRRVFFLYYPRYSFTQDPEEGTMEGFLCFSVLFHSGSREETTKGRNH